MKIDATILKAADKKNNEVRNDRDWEGMEGRAVIS